MQRSALTGSGKLQKIELFISRVERDVKIFEVISQTLLVLELLNSAGIEAQGASYRLDFTAEIERLRGVLSLLGLEDEPPSQP